MNRDAPVKGDTLRQDGQPEFVTVARVVKTQGRIGEVAATLLTDFPEKFATRRKLFAAKQSAGPNAAIQRPAKKVRKNRYDLKLHQRTFNCF